MRTPIPPTGRPRRPARPRRRPLYPSVPSCRWSSSPEGVLHPDDVARSLQRSLHGHHIEANCAVSPLRPAAQDELRGADDPALLDGGDRSQRAAKILAGALPDFNDGQQLSIQAYQIDLPRAAAQVARDELEAPSLQVVGRELLRRRAAKQ